MRLVDRAILGAMNHLLSNASWARDRLRSFAGSVVQVRVGQFDTRFRIDDQGGLQSCGESLPVVTLDLPADLLLKGLTDRSSLASEVRIGGNAEVAEALAFVFKNLRWDAEADLAAAIGDIPARRLFQAGKRGVESLADAGKRMQQNMLEYATDEQGLLCDPALINTFSEDVGSLRDQLARLEKRISLLEH